MKLLEALNIKDRFVEVPDCGRDDFPAFFKEMGFKVGAEIGVYKAEYTKILCSTGLKIYAIDPYLAYDDYNEPNRDFQARQDYICRKVCKRMASYPNCTVIRKTSMDAVKDFKHGDLDFVYIDAHHGFKYVAEDLWEWSKIVKKGGIISGHDYALNNKHARDPYVLNVRYVLDAYVKCFHIEPLFILGRHDAPEGEKRDKWRSWMFINP